MYNAIIDDELLNPCGIYKERFSQSALLAEMRLVSEEEAQSVRAWLDKKGMTFVVGNDEATELTNTQILEQIKMYIAAVRIADAFGCDAIGIQYQLGLKDMTAASDLAEGLLNNVERPAVYHKETGRELFPGKALPHFNEVDEGAGVDALVTNRVWTAMGLDPATTLHDVRWGRHYKDENIDDFVWVFEISGAVPPSHLKSGYAGAVSERQPSMYFPKGGGSIKGESKPGRNCLESGLYSGACPACRYWPGDSNLFTTGGDAVPLEFHDTAMADHERRLARCEPRSIDGPPQGQSYPGRLCSVRGASG